MPSFDNTHVWRRTLGNRATDDPDAQPRKALRDGYRKLRERAGVLGTEIIRSLAEFPPHGLSHSDALWGMADLLLPDDDPLTPTEAFVLGGAFLIHDLGMGLASYPEGLSQVRNDRLWQDTLAAVLRRKLGRIPTATEADAPDHDVELEVMERVLRALHSRRARQLALVSWRDRDRDVEYHLIDDPDLRLAYGELIGRVAASHWWSISEVREEFGEDRTSPPGCPADWTIDLLRVACILRACDAAHLDAARAPGFLRAIRRPCESSRRHWVFMEHLSQPHVVGHRLKYTSLRPFATEEADSWWLCLDALRALDKELRDVDALLADTGRAQLRAAYVAGVEEPLRLAKFIETAGWTPVDAHVRVSDVGGLVAKLGGEELYGSDMSVPLRELVQNGLDAVRARRLLEGRPNDWGRVTVALGEDEEGHWLEVTDDGVGMSTRVLSEVLLDYGGSFWDSDLLPEELPGLAARGFEAVGQYGIGFFSVFMLGDRVKVTSRRYDEGQRDTHVLEFRTGVEARPLLRVADPDERLRGGGTCVRVWLRTPPTAHNGLLMQTWLWKLEELCAWLCPCVDVDLYARAAAAADTLKVVSASDWRTMDPAKLLARLMPRAPSVTEKQHLEILSPFARNSRDILSSAGETVGRGCVSHPATIYEGLRMQPAGVLTVGGLRASNINGLLGVLVGRPLRAARDVAVPVVEDDVLAEWATEQAHIAASTWPENELIEFAIRVRALGGATGPLPIAYSSRGWQSASDIAKWEEIPAEIVLAQQYGFPPTGQDPSPGLLMQDYVLSTVWTGFSVLHTLRAWPHEWPPACSVPQTSRPLEWPCDFLITAVLEALADAWGTSPGAILSASSDPDGIRLHRRLVGFRANEPFTADVYVLRRPHREDARTRS